MLFSNAEAVNRPCIAVFTVNDLHEAIKTLCIVASLPYQIYTCDGTSLKPEKLRQHCGIAIAAINGMIDELGKENENDNPASR